MVCEVAYPAVLRFLQGQRYKAVAVPQTQRSLCHLEMIAADGAGKALRQGHGKHS